MRDVKIFLIGACVMLALLCLFLWKDSTDPYFIWWGVISLLLLFVACLMPVRVS